MKINEPSAVFKLLGGHIIIHLALLTSFWYFTADKSSIVKEYACNEPTEQSILMTLLVSHIATAVISIIYEISNNKGWYSMSAFCEIIRIPTYFYVIMYAGYKGLHLISDEDVGCIDGKLPLHELLIGIELGVFGCWILATPLFLIIAKVFGYDSTEEKLVKSGYIQEVALQESRWRLDFIDYSKNDMLMFQVSAVNVGMTLACFIIVPLTDKGGHLYSTSAETYQHAMGCLLLQTIMFFVMENTNIFHDTPLFKLDGLKRYITVGVAAGLWILVLLVTVIHPGKEIVWLCWIATSLCISAYQMLYILIQVWLEQRLKKANAIDEKPLRQKKTN